MALSPTYVSSPFPKISKSGISAQELRVAVYRSSTRGLPIKIFSFIVPEIIQGSSEANETSPSTSTVPAEILSSPRIPIKRDDFPQATGPTTITTSPGLILKFTLRRHLLEKISGFTCWRSLVSSPSLLFSVRL